MSCLRKGFKANNDREASRDPGVYKDASVICLQYSTACDGNATAPGYFLRSCDTNIVSKTCVTKDNRISTYCSLLLFSPASSLYSSFS